MTKSLVAIWGGSSLSGDLALIDTLCHRFLKEEHLITMVASMENTVSAFIYLLGPCAFSQIILYLCDCHLPLVLHSDVDAVEAWSAKSFRKSNNFSEWMHCFLQRSCIIKYNKRTEIDRKSQRDKRMPILNLTCDLWTSLCCSWTGLFYRSWWEEIWGTFLKL